MDKVIHFTVYFVLGALCVPYVLSSTHRTRTGLLTLAVLLAFATLDEIHQMFIPGRAASLGDWLADSTGAAAGLSIAVFLHLRSKDSS